MLSRYLKTLIALVAPPIYLYLFKGGATSILIAGVWLASIGVMVFKWAGPGLLGLLMSTSVCVYMSLDYLTTPTKSADQLP